MKMINEAYEASVKELQEGKAVKQYEAIPEAKRAIIESIGSILESESVVLSCPEAKDGLVIAEDINSKIFKAVGTAAVSAYNLVLAEALNEEDEGSEEDKKEDEAEDKEGSEEAPAEEDKEEKMDDEEKKETQEALVSFLNASQFQISESLDKPGIVINRNSPHFSAIRDSVLEQLSFISSDVDDAAILEAVVEQYEKLQLKEQGIQLAEAGSPGVFNKAVNAITGLAKHYGSTVTAPFSKAGKAAVKEAGAKAGAKFTSPESTAKFRTASQYAKKVKSGERVAKAAQVGKAAAAVAVPVAGGAAVVAKKKEGK